MIEIGKGKLCAGVLAPLTCLIVLCCSVVGAADWPRWRGPNYDAVSTETGLLKSWPQGGPKLLYEMTGFGPGYSSVAIVDGILYTMGDRSATNPQGGSTKAQCVIAADLAAGKILWATKVGSVHRDGGPRCTPTIDDGLVYTVSTDGNVSCVEAATGRLLWQKNLRTDLGGGNNPGWRFSESPLVDGEKLLCTPGGRKAVMVALNKKSGQLIWKCSMPDIGPKGKDEAGYSSIVPARIAGVKQYVQLTNKGLIGVAANDGAFLWGYNKVANGVANITTPIVDDPYVFGSTAYNTGSALLKLSAEQGKVAAEEVYFLDSRTFQNHHGNCVKVGDYIYAGHDQNKGKPTCVEFKTGKIMWQADQPGGGSAAVLYADGRLYFRYDDNKLALIEASPKAYNLISTFRMPKRDGMSGPGWAHMVIVDGRLYVRHADVLFVYDVKAG
ncbi:MAG: PQQ-like beta-propeller repeat protein [Phycisphaerales bacterium]|nr:MAG: PQQ-like beta-propeller repeat protein [Phycisphaerales bacterium]